MRSGKDWWIEAIHKQKQFKKAMWSIVVLIF
jgi:hypothetical protein